MKTSSWHYKLADIASDHKLYNEANVTVCAYIRKVIYGAGIAGFILSVLAGLAAFIVVGLYSIVIAMLGISEWNSPAVAMAVVLGLISTLVLYVTANSFWKEKMAPSLLKESNHSFSSQVYKKYKQKICFNVEFEDD